jgi:hypothetical protein
MSKPAHDTSLTNICHLDRLHNYAKSNCFIGKNGVYGMPCITMAIVMQGVRQLIKVGDYDET